MDTAETIAHTLKDAYNACKPTPLPAGNPYWVDLSAGRGRSANAVEACHRQIVFSDEPIAQIFAGHRGCGKSTELRRLQKMLEDEGYYVVFFEVDSDLDLQDTEPPDVLLAFLRNVEADLRRRGWPLSDKLLTDLENWFSNGVIERKEYQAGEVEVRTQAQIGGGIPLFGQMMARLTGWIKTGTESKKTVRQELDRRISQLLDHAQRMVKEARRLVQDKGKKDLVVIVDNLDRIVPADRGGGRTSHEVIFIERGDLLKNLGCYSVITVPISLLLSSKQAELNPIFQDRHLVPMVKIHDRARHPWQKGRELLRELLARRIDLDHIFDADVVEFLTEKCGGHPRELMRLVQYTIVEAPGDRVTRDAAERAFWKIINDYSRGTPENHWPQLAEVHLTGEVANTENHQEMLHNLSVLEYQNEERWCDVHPAVLELKPFQRALKIFQAAEKKIISHDA